MSTLIAMLPPKGGPRNDYRLGSETMRIGDKFATLLIVERPRGFFSNLQKRLNYGIDLVLHDAADPGRVEVLTITERGEEFKLRNQAKLISFDGRTLWCGSIFDATAGWFCGLVEGESSAGATVGGRIEIL